MPLDSELDVLVLNQKGWGVRYNANITHLDTMLKNVLATNRSLPMGTVVVLDLAITVATPPTHSVTDPAITAVTGTGDDATIDTNFNNVDTSINEIRTHLDDIKTQQDDFKTQIEAIQTFINDDFLAKLRRKEPAGVPTSVGILNEQTI